MDISLPSLFGFSVAGSLFFTYAGKVLIAIIAYVVGRVIINKVMGIIEKQFEKRKVEKTLNSFLLSFIRVGLYVLLVITVAAMVGIQTSSFVAIIGAAGLAVGLALQGSLSNFAGGVLILLLKPFKVGDYIESSSHSGTVEEIQVFYTILMTPDNKKVIIPNGDLSNSSVINYSAKPTRRVDFEFGVSYEDDIYKVKEVLNKIADEHPLVFKDPAPQVALSKHGDSAVNFILRVWAKSEDYWTIHWDIMEKVKVEFDKAGINIPYPQMDVHMINNK